MGRGARRRRTSFWRAYVLTPLLALIVLALAAGVLLNLTTPPVHHPSQALGQQGHTSSPGGGGAHANTATTTPSPSTRGSRGAATGAARGRGAGHAHAPGAASASTGAKGKGAKTGKGAGSAAHGRHAGHAGAAATTAGAGGAVRLVRSASGVDTYSASHGPLTAHLHVAWLTWVRVVADGRQVLVHEEKSGFSGTYHANHSLKVYLGYPQGSTLSINGGGLGAFTTKSPLWVDVTAGR